MPSAPAKIAAPLPALGTPLAQIRDELQARADAGDADAASRLYRDTQRCADVRRINARSAMTMRLMSTDRNKPSSAEEIQRERAFLDNLEKELNFAADNAALCVGLSDEDINDLVPISMQAAQMGDRVAADCYVGNALYGAKGLLDHPEWLTDYKQNALAIAQNALEGGDWKMVDILRNSYSNNLGISLFSQVTGHDDVQTYRYLKLHSFGLPSGVTSDWTTKLLATEAADISADAKRDADAWAQDAYQRYFNSHPQDPASAQQVNCRSEGLGY